MFRLAQKENLIIPAHIDYLASLRYFITQIGKKYHFSHKFINAFKLAVDEAATNIIKHAYSESEGYITFQAVIKRKSLTLKILDQGAYFDPKWEQEPNLKESINTDEKMGLGIFLMRKLMDQVDYKKSNSGNELTLTKKDKFKKWKLQLFNFSDLPTALKIRYLMHALIFVTILNGAGYYYFHTIANTEVRANFIQAGKKISKQVTQQLSAITPGILNGPDGLSYLKAIILPIYDENLGRIYSLSLEDTLGFIAWSTIPTELNSSFLRPELNTQCEENIFSYNIGSENAIYEFESELIFETGKTFYKKLHVLISNNYLMHEIKKKRITYLKYALFSLGLCFILIAFISYFVSHPIHKLTKWVRAAKTGGLLDEMDIDASTEIGEIAQAFSDITEKFNESQKHLADREKYETEINLAKDIQCALLPREIPEIDTLEISAYYEPAETVGGDFYDFIEVDQDHIGIAIADVSGKGVPGSLMMTIIRTALRTEARGSNDAAEVLIRVNDFVANDMQSGMFATIFYIIINTKTLVANFASAGHNPLILHSRSKKCSFNLNPSGFPVGIKLPIKDYFAQNIKSETIQLAQDELVLLYTDGITEAMNPAKQLYGEQRLLNIISKSANLTVKKFTEKLKNSIYSFTEDIALYDDITFIALKPKKKKTHDIEYDHTLSVNANFLSIDDSNKIIKIISSDPNLGAEGIGQKLNTEEYGKLKVEPERILSELSRRQLHTVALRLKYVESKQQTRFSTATKGYAETISIIEEPPGKLKKQKNKKTNAESIPVNSPSADADYRDPEQIKEQTECAEPSATSEKQADSKKAKAEEPAPADETPKDSKAAQETPPLVETEAMKSSEIQKISDPAVVAADEFKEETKAESSDSVKNPPSAEIPETVEATKSTDTKKFSKAEKKPEAVKVEKITKTEHLPEPENATEPEIADSHKTIHDDAIEFDISDNIDISDLLVDSIFDKFLNKALGEHTLQPNLEEKSLTSDAEPEAELPTPESKNKTKPTKSSKKNKDTKPAAKRKKAKPKRKKKTKTTQVELNPFVAPTQENQDSLEYEFVLGNAAEFIGLESNEEREFEDSYDLSSDLDIEFKHELELEEYELVLDIRADDDDDDFKEEDAKDETDEIVSHDNASASPEQTESATESDAQPSEEIPTPTGNTEDFGLELFADLNIYDDDTFAQDLAEFDQPTLEEKTPKEPKVQEPRPFAALQANEFEDVYRIKPRKSRRKQKAASVTEATDVSAQQEPKTEALRVKTKLIEEPLSESVEISSAQTPATKPEVEPSETEMSNEGQEVDGQYLEGLSASHSEETQIEETKSSSAQEEQTPEVNPEIATASNIENIQDSVTESEGAELLPNDEDTSDTPFTSLKTNEIEDKYGRTDSESSEQEAPEEPTPLVTETSEVTKTTEITETTETTVTTEITEAEVQTSPDELTRETKPEDDAPAAVPVAETPEPNAVVSEQAQVTPPKVTQPEDYKDDLKEYLMTGVKHYKNKEYEDAIIFLKKVIKLDPNQKEAFAMLGNAYYRNGMLYEAIMSYEQLKPDNLKDPSIYENLGLIYWKLHQKKKAVSAWQSLLRLTPERKDIKKRIDYLEQNGTKKLKTQIRNISDKQNGEAKNNVSDNGKQAILKKAFDQYRSQDYKSAIDSLKLALEHFPENTEVYTYLANSYFRNKMFDDAVEIYERLKKLDENNTNVRENLGMLHLKQGAFKQAIAEWQQIVNKQPGRADLKQKIAKVSKLIKDN